MRFLRAKKVCVRRRRVQSVRLKPTTMETLGLFGAERFRDFSRARYGASSAFFPLAFKIGPISAENLPSAGSCFQAG
jgi:hypothetical protein